MAGQIDKKRIIITGGVNNIGKEAVAASSPKAPRS